MIAERLAVPSGLDPDQCASYAAPCADIVTILGVTGAPRTARDEGRAVTRAYARALAGSAPGRRRTYYRAVTGLLSSCAAPAESALDFAAVAACSRLRAFVRGTTILLTKRPRSGLPEADRGPPTTPGDRRRPPGCMFRQGH